MVNKKILLGISFFFLGILVFPKFSLADTCPQQCSSLSPDRYQQCINDCNIRQQSQQQNQSQYGSGGGGGMNGVEIPTDTGLPDPSGGIKEILNNLLMWMLEVFGIVAIISFIVAGVQYMMSGGDDAAMKTAKKHMTYSVYGVIAALSGVIVLKAVDAILNASTSKF